MLRLRATPLHRLDTFFRSGWTPRLDTCARRLRLCCASTHARSADPTPSLTPHRSVLCHTADERRNDSTLGKWQRDKEWRGERFGVLDAGRRRARRIRTHACSSDTLACCEPQPTCLGAAPYTADERRNDSALGKWRRDREWRGERSGVLSVGRRHAR